MRYLSVCSGIEAASCAWHPFGWQAVAFSEIDAFPSAVLAAHYPSVPNWGDMTKFREWPDAAIDVLVGGTPCQSFSIAGLRKGLADPRGNLMLTYLAIADRYRPEWLVWENVPGVLSSNGGRDFGTFLGGLGELGYGFAYTVLDAQYFGVPQRRRRVFVVGCLGDWRRAAAVLFERESLRWNPAPSREAGERTSPCLSARTSAGGGLGTDHDINGGLIASHDVAQPLLAKSNSSHRADAESYIGVPERARALTSSNQRSTPLVPVSHALDSYSAGRATEDGTGLGCPLVSVAFAQNQRDEVREMDMAGALAGKPGMKQQTYVAYGLRSDAARDGSAKTPSADSEGRVRLRDPGFNAYEQLAPTIDSGQPHTVAFSCKDHGAHVADTAPTLRAMGHDGSHANAGGQVAVAFQSSQSGMRCADTHATLDSNNGSRRHHGTLAGMQVRRLTPRECERLQGFPDDYTLITYRGKPAADGPRYKALGNSMAVPCMRWIGERIAQVAAIGNTEKAA